MIILQIVLATIIGTTIMTAFSYIISIVRGKQFREPVLLNKILDRWTDMSIYPHSSNPLGWLGHFVVGLVFVLVFHLLWVYTRIEVSLLNSAIMGAVGGLIGIGIWMFTFVIHPNPPKVHFLGFFGQLFFAHVFFGAGAWIGYMIPLWARW